MLYVSQAEHAQAAQTSLRLKGAKGIFHLWDARSGSGRKGGGSSLVSKDVKQVPPVKAQAFLYGVKGACTTPEVRDMELRHLVFEAPITKPPREQVGHGQSSANPGAELVAKPPTAPAPCSSRAKEVCPRLSPWTV